MAAPKDIPETAEEIAKIAQMVKNDILQDSDDDMLLQALLEEDRIENPNDWPGSPDSEPENDWSQAVFHTGPGFSIERHPRSREQALKWRDLCLRAVAIRQVCSIYSDLDAISLANVYLVTTCFALGRPLMPQGAVISFLETWANVDLDVSLPFPERARSGILDTLAEKPSRNSVLSEGIGPKVPRKPPVPVYGDSEGPESNASEEQPQNETFIIKENKSVIPYTNTSPHFSPLSSKAIGGRRFYQSYPPPLLGPVLERILENYVQGAYEQEALMETYMQVMRHPSIPRVRKVGRELFDRVSRVQAPYISPSSIVEDLLGSLKIDPDLHLPTNLSAMQKLIGWPDFEAKNSSVLCAMRTAVDLMHSNVQNGYLQPTEALAFFKQHSGKVDMSDISMLKELTELFFIPTSYYPCSGNLGSGGGHDRLPISRQRKQERPLRGDTIFPGLQLSDSEPGSVSPEDGVTEDLWGLLMPSKKARKLTETFNLGRMRDHIRSKTPRREVSRKEKTNERRRVLQKSDTNSEKNASSGDSLFALPGEDTKSFIQRNPPKKIVRSRRREREGTPRPETKASTPPAPSSVTPEAGACDRNDSSSHPTTESSTSVSSPNAESPETKETSVSPTSPKPRSLYDIVSSEANKSPGTLRTTKKGRAAETDEEREDLAFLRSDDDPSTNNPLPISIHEVYKSASQRPIHANFDSTSYFQSPQASSPGVNSALNKIFDTYRDDVENKPDMIGIEGAMKYLRDIGVQLDEVACFAIAELLQSPSMGEFTRSGFLAGWKRANCETLQMQAAHADTLRSSIVNDPDLFRRVYRYTFPICRLAGQKILPLEIACEQWRLFFTPTNGGITWNSPSTPWLDWWIEYLNEVIKRPINKDLWEQTEVLVRKTKEDENFGWWNAEGAWPGAIDDFVGWVKNKRGGSNPEAEAMEIE